MALDIRIPNPCTQRWDDLQPAEDGTRLCPRCRHHVTDFRGMSDDEVALAHALAGGRICGVYDEAQLRGDEPRRAPTPPRLVTLALGATLLSGTAAAQSPSPPAPATVQTPLSPPRAPAANASAAESAGAPTETFKVRGTVRDEAGNPLGGAFVMVVGDTDLRTRTDSLGAYMLRLREGSIDRQVQLLFAQLGRRTVTVEVPADVLEPTIDMILPVYVLELEGVVMSSPPPLEQRSIFSRLLSIFRDYVDEAFATLGLRN